MAFSLAHDVSIGDRQVRIRCAGTGRPLLLLHDIGGCGASFAGFTSGIVAAGREAVAPDLPGFAQSDPITGDLDAYIDYVQDLCDRTVEGRVDVVGHGFGGYLALSLAAQRPERFRRVVLLDPMTPPPAGGRATRRMGAAMALNGALTTVRRGRILQNVGGFGRAKAMLEQLARPDQTWWDGLNKVQAECLILDLGGARVDNRHRMDLLTSHLAHVTQQDLASESHHFDAAGATQQALLDFVV